MSDSDDERQRDTSATVFPTEARVDEVVEQKIEILRTQTKLRALQGGVSLVLANLAVIGAVATFIWSGIPDRSEVAAREEAKSEVTRILDQQGAMIEARMRDAQAKIDELHVEIGRTRGLVDRVSELGPVVDALTDRMDQIEEQATSEEAALERLKLRLTEADRVLKSVEGQILARTGAELDELLDRFEALGKHLAADGGAAQLADLETRLDDLDGVASEASQEASRANTRISGLRVGLGRIDGEDWTTCGSGTGQKGRSEVSSRNAVVVGTDLGRDGCTHRVIWRPLELDIPS